MSGGSGWRPVVLLLLGALGVGIILIANALSPDPPPDPDALGVLPSVAPAADALPRANPTEIDIPDIDLNADVEPTGVESDGTVQTPTLDDPELAGWYENGASPGEAGPAILFGHVDTFDGPGVFYDLGQLEPGDEVRITRDDSLVAVYRVDTVRSFPKDQFPTADVYGAAAGATLRLVTCGGSFDDATRNYSDNVIAFATLVGSEPA